jgi:MFS family permease
MGQARGQDVDTVAVATGAALSWRAVATVGTLLVIAQAGVYLIPSALPLYLRHLGAAPVHIGVEVGASNLAAVVFTLFCGPLINRWGPSRLMIGGVVCYLLAALGMLLVPSEGSVAGCRALQGLGLALVYPSLLTMAPRLVPLGPGAALGLAASFNTIAMAAAPPIGLWLYGQGGAPALFGPAAACAAVGLGVAFALPTTPRRATPARGLGYDRRWTALLLANAFCGAYFGGVVAYLPLALAHVGGPNAGIFFTADALSVLLLRAPTGALVDRSGPRIVQLAGVLITLAGLGALALPASLPTLVAAGAGTGIGAGLFISAVLVTLSRRSGDHNRGTAMALSSASLNIGMFACAALSGLLYGAAGFGAVLLFGATTTLAALPCVLADRAPAEPDLQYLGKDGLGL